MRILATSRAPLHLSVRLYGGQEYLVPSLALPDLTLLSGALANDAADTLLRQAPPTTRA